MILAFNGQNPECAQPVLAPNWDNCILFASLTHQRVRSPAASHKAQDSGTTTRRDKQPRLSQQKDETFRGILIEGIFEWRAGLTTWLPRRWCITMASWWTGFILRAAFAQIPQLKILELRCGIWEAVAVKRQPRLPLPLTTMFNVHLP